MPDSKISALPSATVPLAGTEVLPIVQSSVTDKVTAADLLRQNGQTVTTSNPVLSLAQTWNAGGVTFTGLKFNATDTASAAASLLLDLQVGGTSQFKVDRTGIVTAQSAVAGTVGWFQSSVVLGSLTGGDTILARDAANTLALRNSTNAQSFRVYNTYTDASNYERALSGWGGGVYYIGTEKLGTGSTRAMSILIGGTTAWSFDTSRNFVAGADNTYDIGASGATRPRSIYTGTQFIGPDGSDASPSFTFGASQTGMYRDSGGGRIRFAIGGTFGVSIASGGIGLASDTAFLQMGQSSDVVLNRDAANTLALRNSTNAQTFRVYNTYTDASNYERLAVEWTGNTAYIRTQNTGTGASRSIILSASTAFYFGGGASYQWLVSSSGHLLANTDNTYDIGASGATRPRNLYVGSSVFTGGSIQVSTAGSYQFTGRGDIISNADGVFQLRDNAGTSFGRLQFGGTTSSFPSLARSGTTIQARLADNSSLSSFECSALDATVGNVRVGSSVLAHFATAIPAGGTAGAGLRVSSTSNFGVFFGSGAPTLSAAKGSLYLRSDGSGTGDRMYVNTDGSTTWTAVTTAA